MRHDHAIRPTKSTDRSARHATMSGGAALLAALAMAAPSVAQDSATAEATKAIAEQTALINAKTARTQAETADMQARLTALGLAPAKGETTLKENAGQMEAAMLTASAMKAAAVKIASTLPANGDILVLRADEKVDLSLPLTLTTQMETAALQARALATAACSPTGGARPTAFFDPALIGAVVSLLKVDTTIGGVEVKFSEPDRLLINSLVGLLGARAILPSEAMLPSGLDAPGVGQAWNNLSNARMTLSNCRAKLAATPKADLKAVDAGLVAIDALTTALTTAEEGASPLVRALQLQQVSTPGVQVLRVATDYTGGTVVQRKHIGTMFGATGVSLTGGLVASYRLTDPRTGKVTSSGGLICPTDLVGLREVHRGEVEVGACADVITKARS